MYDELDLILSPVTSSIALLTITAYRLQAVAYNVQLSKDVARVTFRCLTFDLATAACRTDR